MSRGVRFFMIGLTASGAVLSHAAWERAACVLVLAMFASYWAKQGERRGEI